MAMQFASAQLIKYVTERVLENVLKQLPREQAGVTHADPQALAAAAAANPEGLDAIQANTAALRSVEASFASVQATVRSLREDMARLEEQMGTLQARMTRLERKWGWRALLRIVFAVALAFALGFGAALGGKALGWM